MKYIVEHYFDKMMLACLFCVCLWVLIYVPMSDKLQGSIEAFTGGFSGGLLLLIKNVVQASTQQNTTTGPTVINQPSEPVEEKK